MYMKYLLLRDNKQTGPYSTEELIAKGLKPYDLVWLEGKSAAWRYPSEIQELKPFAPVVEEQPSGAQQCVHGVGVVAELGPAHVLVHADADDLVERAVVDLALVGNADLQDAP